MLAGTPTAALRRAGAPCIGKFRGKGAKKKADMDSYLDANALEVMGKGKGKAASA